VSIIDDAHAEQQQPTSTTSGMSRAPTNMPDHRTYPPFAESRIPHVGTYRRVLPVSLERMYENTLDWEHLPHVHASSFAAIECESAGPWGWRARVTNARGVSLLLDLRLDRECRRWITRTLEGPNPGSEIWTHAFAVGERRTDVVIDFFVPGIAATDRDAVGAAFSRNYARLYDEDVAMMTERQRQLDQRIDRETPATGPLCIGARENLGLPRQVEFRGRTYHVAEVDGELVAHATRCPHQLGPLAATRDGVVQCPWHGYRFDVRSGACISGQPCRLPPAPTVTVHDGNVWLDR
jgi:nitrite reductase/ring-hydroxylating ferredoxin subunit